MPSVHRPLRMMSGAQQDSSRKVFETISGGPFLVFIEQMRSTGVILTSPSRNRRANGGSQLERVKVAPYMETSVAQPLHFHTHHTTPPGHDLAQKRNIVHRTRNTRNTIHSPRTRHARHEKNKWPQHELWEEEQEQPQEDPEE